MSESENTFHDESLSRRQQLQWELLTSLGIISQLSTERARVVLGDDLPLPLFTILNHMIRLGDGTTVTDLARAFQSPQPGMSKSVQKLIGKGYMSAKDDADDARRKLLFLTESGRAAHRRALGKLGPDANFIFDDWTTEEMAALQKPLFRLRRWLDTHRGDLPGSGEVDKT
ncbi:MarR family winged helix-turn-helix transcriptional regulator [Minwuia sp.]|uniref:MarR family winged helix-turn-helix transcriptional regulator n=1 Tax=Minwuia sp. TaxID=2493630 RepID=UPI003A8DDF07